MWHLKNPSKTFFSKTSRKTLAVLWKIPENIRDDFTTAAKATKINPWKEQKKHTCKQQPNHPLWKSDERLLAAKEYVCIHHITTTEIQDVIRTMRTFTQLSLNHRLCLLLACLTNSEMHFTESAVLQYNLHQLFSTWRGELSHFLSCGSTEETTPHMLSSLPQPPQKQSTAVVHRELGPHTWKCWNLLLNFLIWSSEGFNPACN